MAYHHLPQSFSTVPEDTAHSNTVHVHTGHAKCILSILLQKYCNIELEISLHILSRAWNFKIMPKNKIQSVSQLSCWFSPASNPIYGGLQTSSNAAQGQQSVYLSPALLSTSIMAPRGGSYPQHQRSVPVIRDTKGLGTVLHWSQGSTEEFPWRSSSEKKKCHGQNFCLQTWKQAK